MNSDSYPSHELSVSKIRVTLTVLSNIMTISGFNPIPSPSKMSQLSDRLIDIEEQWLLSEMYAVVKTKEL